MMFVRNIKRKGAMKALTAFAIGMCFPLVSSGCFLLPKEEAVMAPPLNKPSKVYYDTIDIKNGTIEKKIMCIGSLVSVSQKELFFTGRGGYLKEIYVKPGDWVKAGDVVAELVTSNLENDIKLQELNVRKVQMNFDKIKADSENGKIPPDIALARIQLEDLQRLYDKTKDISTPADIANLKSQIEQKKISLAKIEDQYKRDLEAAALNLEIENIRLNNLLQEKQNAILTSTIDGKVVYSETKLKAGDYVNTYKMLVRVADLNQLQVQYSDSNNASDLRLGVKVDVKISNKNYTGEVVMTPANAPPDAEDIVKKSTRIAVDNLPKDISIGTSAEISLLLFRKENAIIIPKNAIRTFNSRRFVQILEDGMRKERDIETGLSTDAEIEVVKGLKEGDKLIID